MKTTPLSIRPEKPGTFSHNDAVDFASWPVNLTDEEVKDYYTNGVDMNARGWLNLPYTAWGGFIMGLGASVVWVTLFYVVRVYLLPLLK